MLDERIYRPVTSCADLEDSLGLEYSPQELIKDECMRAVGLHPTALAQKMGIHKDEVKALLRGEYKITPDIAQRLSRVFSGTSANM